MKKKKIQEKTMDSSVFFLLVMITFLFLGQISGIRLCAVVSWSMEPNLPTWSLSIVNTKASYDSIQTGDIVVYYRRSDHTRIIHRVTEIEPNGMVTKGDANSVTDGLSVGRDNLFGKYLFHIPYLGYFSKLGQRPIVRVGFFLCMVMILAVDIVDRWKSSKCK